MSSLRLRGRRRGVTLVVVLLTMGIVVLGAVGLARLAVLEFIRERHAALRICADQVIASAHDWSRVHGAELTAPRALPLENLLPPEVTGTVSVRPERGPEGMRMVCAVTLERAGRRLREETAWPLAASARPATPSP